LHWVSAKQATPNFGRKKIMTTAKPAKKGKTLGSKKLEKKVPLNRP
jgi:hypothetical protein